MDVSRIGLCGLESKDCYDNIDNVLRTFFEVKSISRTLLFLLMYPRLEAIKIYPAEDSEWRRSVSSK